MWSLDCFWLWLTFWQIGCKEVIFGVLKRQLQPKTVLLRTTPTRIINQLQTLTHLGHNPKQSFSGLHQPGRSTNYKDWLTWVTTQNSPTQDCTNPDDQPTTNIDSLGSQPKTVLRRTAPAGWSTNYKHWLTWVTTQNSPSQDCTSPDDQPTTNIDSLGSQPKTVLLRTTPTRTINQLQTLTHLGHNPKQSFSGLHQPGRSTNYKHWLTWVTTQNSPQDCTSPDDQPATNIDSLGSQPKTVLLRTAPARTINQLQTWTHLGHNPKQSFSGLHQPGRSTSYKHWLTWVTTQNSPSQDYTNPDDQPTTNMDSPGSQPKTVLLRTTPTRTINQLQILTHLRLHVLVEAHNIQQTVVENYTSERLGMIVMSVMSFSWIMWTLYTTRTGLELL